MNLNTTRCFCLWTCHLDYLVTVMALRLLLSPGKKQAAQEFKENYESIWWHQFGEIYCICIYVHICVCVFYDFSHLSIFMQHSICGLMSWSAWSARSKSQWQMLPLTQLNVQNQIDWPTVLDWQRHLENSQAWMLCFQIVYRPLFVRKFGEQFWPAASIAR